MIGDIIQPTHLIFILVVALLVLGPKRLPEVGRSLGRGIRDFRDAMTNSSSEARELFYGEQALAGDHTPTGQPPATTTPTSPLTSSPSLVPEPDPAPVSSSWSAPEPAPVASAWSEPETQHSDVSETSWPQPATAPTTGPAQSERASTGNAPADARSEISVAEPVYGD